MNAAQAIADPADPRAVSRELSQLPAGRRLAGSGDQAVWRVRWAEAPSLMHELGRLREQTFRAAGEGTGRALDLDPFDEHYEHLVLWDAPGRRVLGAYRLGHVPRILAARGPGGLYTSTLFAFDPGFFGLYAAALELGRSFLCAEAQRSPGGLALLWQGIGRVIAEDGGVRALFGPVSVDRGYTPESLDLIVGHLAARRALGGGLVSPRLPHAPASPDGLARGAALPDERALDEAVRRAQPDGRGLPVLLRQYLKLNARVAAFNIDPDFADVLDALIVVDLPSVEPRRLARFMGEAEARALLGRAAAWPPSRPDGATPGGPPGALD